MSDRGNFSLDDILNEYSGKKNSAGQSDPSVSFVSKNDRKNAVTESRSEDISEEKPAAEQKTAERIKRFEVHIPEDGELPPVPEESSDDTVPYDDIADDGYDDTYDNGYYGAEEQTADYSEEYYQSGYDEEPYEDIPDEDTRQVSEEELAALYENSEPVEKYVRRKRNRGGGFTMRTSDDDDPGKQKSVQREYQRRGEESVIREQITRLKENLTVRAAVLLFCSVFSLLITAGNDLGLPMAAVFDRTVSPSAYVFTNTMLGLVAIAFSYNMVFMGIKGIIKRSPDGDTAAAMNILAALIAGIVTLFKPEPVKQSYFHIYMPAALIMLLLNTLGKLSAARRTLRNFEFVSHTDSFAAVQQADDPRTAERLTGGKSADLAFMRRSDFVKDFMKNSYSSDMSDLYAEKTSLLILAAALAVGVLSFIFDRNASVFRDKLYVFFAAMSGTISLCSPIALTLTANRPLAKASRKALENSAVLLGYSSVEEHADVTSAAADITELFPTGTVSFANLKVLGPLMIDKAVVYGASLAEAGGSLTRPAFYKMLHGDGGMLMPVDDCRIEKNGGISGIADGKFMLFGSRTLMEEHNVSGLPPENNEKSFSGQNPVCYLSVSGRAVMMFAVRLTPERSSVRWIQELASEKVLLNVSAADDFISAHRIAKCYGISPNLVRLFSPEGERIFDDLASPTDSLSASMFCTGHVSGFALLLVAAKRVRLAANLGTALQYGSMLLGIAVSLILMLMGAFSQLTATMVVLYHAAFMFIAEFIQGTKDI